MTEPELFDSSEYCVPPPPPPPTRLKITVDVWSKTFERVLYGRPLELYNAWKETEHPDDEEAFAECMIDEIHDYHLIDMSLSDWEEVPNA